MAEVKVERQKAKSKGFAAFGVPVGSTLTFRKDPAVTCKTADDKNKVEYNGKVYPISGLAKELMNTPISGYHAFRYNGVLPAKLGGGKTEAAQAPQEAAKPAETAPVAPQAPASPTPQTVPLPRPSETPVKPQNEVPAEGGDQSLDPLAGMPPADGEEA